MNGLGKINIFQAVSDAAKRNDLEFVVIGGFAVIEHGYARFTADCDLLVRREEKSKWHELLLGLGYQLDAGSDAFSQYKLSEGADWPVDLMFAKDATFLEINGAAKHGVVRGVGVKLVSLDHLFVLKLHALKHSNINRFLKDFADVVNLVRINRIDLYSPPMRDLFLKYGNADLYGKVCRAAAAR